MLIHKSDKANFVLKSQFFIASNLILQCNEVIFTSIIA